MSVFRGLDGKFVSTALDKSRRDREIKRLEVARMIMLSLLVVIILLDISLGEGKNRAEIQNFTLSIMLLICLMYNRIQSDVRLLKIVGALSRETGKTDGTK
jgi:hypothetical protein